MEYGEVRLRRGEDLPVRQGGCRVYDNQVAWADESCADGGVAALTAHDGTFLGLGFFNSRSKIVLRLLTRRDEPIDRAFLPPASGMPGSAAGRWALRMPAGWCSGRRTACPD